MKDQTDQEIIDWLKIDAENDGNTEAARMKIAAAERIRVLGEEVDAGRAHDEAVEEYEYSGKASTGPEYRNSMERMTKARAATDAARGGTR